MTPGRRMLRAVAAPATEKMGRPHRRSQRASHPKPHHRHAGSRSGKRFRPSHAQMKRGSSAGASTRRVGIITQRARNALAYERPEFSSSLDCPFMPVRSYMSRREVEQERFHPAMALLAPLGSIVLQILLPRLYPPLVGLDLPLIVMLFFAVSRRSPIAGHDPPEPRSACSRMCSPASRSASTAWRSR